MKHQVLIEKAEAFLATENAREEHPSNPILAELVDTVKKLSEKNEKSKQKEEKSKLPERTIETMFRVTATNSQRLSDQADAKANIMIQVNSIIITGLFIFKDKGGSSDLDLPMATLLAVNILTIIFATLATRPQIPKGTFTQREIDENKADLLFFGNFFKMPFPDYAAGMFKIMNEKTNLHTTLLLDIYNQGLVLGRKYKMLTFAYNVFMFGLILAVLTFFIAINPNFLH